MVTRNIKIAFYITCIFIIASCATKSYNETNKLREMNEYGYSPNNPIKIGAFETSPEGTPRFNKNHFIYLSSLKGPNGESTTFKRIGSCCYVKSDNSPFGDSVPLDKYEVQRSGKYEPVIIYINMYDKEETKILKGFTN